MKFKMHTSPATNFTHSLQKQKKKPKSKKQKKEKSLKIKTFNSKTIYKQLKRAQIPSKTVILFVNLTVSRVEELRTVILCP